jgi:hypothetical protein
LKIYSFLSFLLLSWIYQSFVLSRLLFWTRESAKSLRKIQSFLKNVLSLTMMLRVFARCVTRILHFRIRTIVLLKKKRENLHLERSQWNLVLIQKKTQIDWNILRLILLSIVFTSKKSKICCASFHSSRRDQNVKKKALKKNKKRMSFEILNQYRENRSISNESDASLTQEIFAERKLFESISHEKRTIFVVKKTMQIKFSTTISSLQILQMLSRWLIIMFASEISKTFLFDEYNITKFLDRYADLC